MIQRLKFGLLVLAVFCLLAVAWINHATPFRGEHWALLIAYLDSPSWLSAIHRIANFECFTVRRFQPFAFFPSVLLFRVFKENFFWHYLVAVLCHVGYTYFFLRLLNRFLKRPGKLLFLTYPLEAALFSLLFFGADILTWTFFLYIQVACLLMYGGLVFFLERKPEKAWPLLLLAPFFYEPAIIMAVALAIAEVFSNRVQWRRYFARWIVVFLGISIEAYLIGQRYSEHYSQVSALSGSSLPPLVSFSPFQKGLTGIFKFSIFITSYLSNFFLPAAATRNEIFEVKLPVFLEALPFSTFFGIFSLCVVAGYFLSRKFLRRENRNLRALLIVTLGLLFLSIAWPRTEASLYVSHQFRYTYLFSGILVVLLLEVLSAVRVKRGYSLILMTLIAFHGFRTVEHAGRVRTTMLPLAEWVQRKREAGVRGGELVRETSRLLTQQHLSLPLEEARFIYNANSCIIQWELRK